MTTPRSFSQEILPLDVAVSRGLLTEQLSAELMQNQSAIARAFASEQRADTKFRSSLESISEADEAISSSSSDAEEPAKVFDVISARDRAWQRHELRKCRFRHRRMSTIYEEDEDVAIEPRSGNLTRITVREGRNRVPG